MAQTTTTANNAVKRWENRFFTEFVQQNRFSRYMGTSSGSIIQVLEQNGTTPGKTISQTLLNRLTGGAITDSATLEGNEEAMTQRTFEVDVHQYRNAILVPTYEQHISAIDLANGARELNMTWAMELQRDQTIEALGSINGVAYGSASEAQKDAWLVDNADRVLFGAVKSNNSSNDHSASLANIDNTADKLTPGMLSLLKRMAREASPKVRPIRVANGDNFYVAFTGTRAFRDLKNDTTITQAQRDVVIRNQNNKLFMGGDIEWDGIVVHEIDDIPVLTGVGAGGIDVQPVYFCGAQALAHAWGSRWSVINDTRDYGDKRGTGVKAIYGIKKALFGSGAGDRSDLKDHGVVTAYVAGVADS